MLHKLSRLVEVHNIAVVVTNQVQSQPDDFFSGGNGLRSVICCEIRCSSINRLFPFLFIYQSYHSYY